MSGGLALRGSVLEAGKESETHDRPFQLSSGLVLGSPQDPSVETILDGGPSRTCKGVERAVRSCFGSVASSVGDAPIHQGVFGVLAEVLLTQAFMQTPLKAWSLRQSGSAIEVSARHTKGLTPPLPPHSPAGGLPSEDTQPKQRRSI